MNSFRVINIKFITINIIFLVFSSFGFSQTKLNQKSYYSELVDVINYNINLDLTNLATHRLNGYTIIRLTPKENNLNQLNFYLLSLNIDSIFIDGVRNSNYFYNDTIISIQLSTGISPLDTIDAKIFYQGTPKQDPSGWGGFTFSSDNNFAYNLGVGMESNPHVFGRVWFPCIDEFNERATFKCNIRVDANKFAVCGGVLDSISNNIDATKTFYWNLTDSIPTYLASVAVGPYVALNDTFNGIERDIPINLYVRAVDTTRTKQSFINLKNALSIFEAAFGPYQWQRVGYVGIPFNSGAMEHATNIAYPISAIDGTLSNELLFVHELSHSWFGNLITCDSERDMWINEGWASYCEPLFLEKYYGVIQARNNIHSTHAEVLKTAHVNDGSYLAVGNLPHEYTYGTTAYKKGAGVVHTLRNYMGDSLFFAAVKQVLSMNKFSSINSISLKNKLSAFSGKNLTDFFNAWVFSPGFPMFSIDSIKVLPSLTTNKNVVVYLREQLKESTSLAYDNVGEITFMNQNWDRFTKRVHFSAPIDSVIVNVPFEPSIAIFDLYEKMCDATTDLFWIIKTPRLVTYSDLSFKLNVINVSDSAFLRVQKCWIGPDSLISPVNNLHLATKQHWKVNGILPSNFYAKGSFIYQLSNGFDSVLHINYVDSIRLLYRENKKSNWQFTNFAKAGNVSYLTLTVDTLKIGEYCMGILKNDLPTKMHNAKIFNSEATLKIIPNPSKQKITIEYEIDKNALIKIINSSGVLVADLKLNKFKKEVVWDPSPFGQGIYIIQLIGSNNELLKTEKLIYYK